jgi:hypothetical protein
MIQPLLLCELVSHPSHPVEKSLSENWERCCGLGFWIWPRRSRRNIPGAGCDACDNEGQIQKTCRPEGFRGNSRLASLLLSRRPTWGMGFPSPASQFPQLSCALSRNAVTFVAPRHTAIATKTAPLPIFSQALRRNVFGLFCGFMAGGPLRARDRAAVRLVAASPHHGFAASFYVPARWVENEKPLPVARKGL